MQLQTSAEIAMARARVCAPETPEFTLVRENLSCDGMHNSGGYPLEGVTEYRVNSFSVGLHPPGANVMLVRGDGWIDPVQLVKLAGCDNGRPLCFHRNVHNGIYMVFQRAKPEHLAIGGA